MMKRAMSCFFRLMLLCLFLAGCVNAVSNEESAQTFDFSIHSPDEEGQFAVQRKGYTLSVVSDISELTFSGEPLKLEFQIENTASDLEVGFQIVSNGAISPCMIDGEEKDLHVFQLSEKETKIFTAEFMPFGTGESYFQPVGILDPSTKLSGENKSFGNAFRVVTTSPIGIAMEQENPYAEKVSSDFISEEMSENSAKKWNVPYQCGRQVFLSQTEGIRAVITDAEVNASYLLSFFVNGKPLQFQNGCKAIKITQQAGSYTIVEIQPDSALVEGDVISAILAPTDGSHVRPETFLINANPLSIFGKDEPLAPAALQETTESETVSGSAETFMGTVIGSDLGGTIYGAEYSSISLLDRLGKKVKTYAFSDREPSELFFAGINYHFFAADFGAYCVKQNSAYDGNTEPFGKTVYLFDSELNQTNEFYLSECEACAVSSDLTKISVIRLEDSGSAASLYEISGNDTNLVKSVGFPSDIPYVQAIAFSDQSNTLGFIANPNNGEYNLLGTLNLENESIQITYGKGKYAASVQSENGNFLFTPTFDFTPAILMSDNGTAREFYPESEEESVNCILSGGKITAVSKKDGNSVIRVYSPLDLTKTREIVVSNSSVYSAVSISENLIFYKDEAGSRPVNEENIYES